MGRGCETAEPQQDSSPRGGQCGSKHAAQTAPSKPLKAKQNTQSKFLKRLRGAWLRNSGTPAGFKSKGWPMRLQTCCPNGTFETPKSKAKHAEQVRKKASWGVFATQRNPSRIQVQGVTFETLKAKQNTQSNFVKRLRGAWLRHSGTPAGFKSKGWPVRFQTWC